MDKRILLIDDDINFRRAMVPILKEHNCLVMQASTTEEATDAVNTGEFDLFIVDGQLADSSGVEWLRDIRKKEIKTPAVFASGHFRDSSSFTQLVQDLDVCLVIHKPVSLSNFEKEIRRILDEGDNESAINKDLTNYLSNITKDYIRQLPSELAELKELIEKAKTPPDDRKTMQKAAQLAHKLYGTSGSYGLNEISGAFNLIEKTLNSMLFNKLTMWNSKGWTVIQEALQLASADSSQMARTLDIKSTSPLTESKQNLAKTTGNNSDRLPRVLLLDDDRSFSKRIEALLSAEGIMSYSFVDTNFILDILAWIKPDLLLLDVDMPERNGLDICSFIRQTEEWHNLPIFLVTAKNGATWQKAAFAAGASEFIEKPIVNTKLLECISHWLESPGKWHLCQEQHL